MSNLLQRIEALADALGDPDFLTQPVPTFVQATLPEPLTWQKRDAEAIEASPDLHTLLSHIAPRAEPLGATPRFTQQLRAELWRRWRERTTLDETPPPDGLSPGMERVALERWAQDHHVVHWLDVIATQALLESSPDWEPLRAASIAEIICGDLEPGVEERGLTSLQRATLELLQRVARAAQSAREEAQRRHTLRTPPEDPALAALWHDLDARRQRLLRFASPRAADGLGAHRVCLDEPPLRLTYTERVRARCGDQGSPAEVSIVLEDDTLAVTCGCSRPRPCSIQLAAVDATLDALSGFAHHELLGELRDALSTPRWERGLQLLDELLTAHADLTLHEEPAWLGWRISARSLEVTPALLREKKRGTGVVSRSVDSAELYARSLEPLDREILLDLELYRQSLRDLETHHLRLLRALSRHPHVYRSEGQRVLPIDLHVHDARIHVSAQGGRLLFQLDTGHGLLHGDDAQAWLERLEREVFDARWTTRERLTVSAVPPNLPEALRLLQDYGADMPRDAVAAFLARAPELTRSDLITLAPELRGPWAPPWNRPRLELEARRGALHVALLIRPLEGGPAVVPGQGPPVSYALRDGQPLHTERDPAAERRTAQLIAAQLGLDDDAWSDDTPFTCTLADLEDALHLIERARDLRDDLDVAWTSQPLSLLGAASPRHLRLHLDNDAPNQLAVSGGLSLDDDLPAVPLMRVLKSVREGRRFIPVSDDARSWIRLEDALLKHLTPIAETLPDDANRPLSTATAPLLLALADDGAALSGLEFTERVQRAHTLPGDPPEGLEATLRPYQREGVRWLIRLAHWAPGAILADDMGLGKTLQALALLLHRADDGPALACIPASLSYNWCREAARFTPALRALPIRAGSELDALDGAGPGDLVVASYDLIARHADAFRDITWTTLVLDEAQAIKNPDTLRAQAIHAIATHHARFTLALTGTPIENRVAELWSLAHATLPGLLGPRSRFHARFAIPIERHHDAQRADALGRLIRPFLLRRLKTDVAPDLPPRDDVRVDVQLSHAERALYEPLRRALLDDLQRSDDRFQILAALLRLRQLACHPRLVDPTSDVPSSKLAHLRQLVLGLREGGHRALVFSAFTSHLALAREALEADSHTCAYLDGAMSARARQRAVDDFQAGRYDVFLLSIKAGGTGLNLTAADYVIHLDPWWNPAVEDQATDRAHRIGQDKPVTVYRLVTSGTIEEAIYDLHHTKRDLANAILGEGGQADAGPLSLDALRDLLQAHAPASADTPPPDTPEPAPAATPAVASWSAESATRAFAEHLDQAVADDALTPASARNYTRKGKRYIAWLAQRDDEPITADAVLALADTYADDITHKRYDAPKSDRASAHTIARRLAQALAAPARREISGEYPRISDTS